MWWHCAGASSTARARVQKNALLWESRLATISHSHHTPAPSAVVSARNAHAGAQRAMAAIILKVQVAAGTPTLRRADVLQALQDTWPEAAERPRLVYIEQGKTRHDKSVLSARACVSCRVPRDPFSGAPVGTPALLEALRGVAGKLGPAPSAQLALHTKLPQDKLERDPRDGTIEADADYKRFLAYYEGVAAAHASGKPVAFTAWTLQQGEVAPKVAGGSVSALDGTSGSGIPGWPSTTPAPVSALVSFLVAAKEKKKAKRKAKKEAEGKAAKKRGGATGGAAPAPSGKGDRDKKTRGGGADGAAKADRRKEKAAAKKAAKAAAKAGGGMGPAPGHPFGEGGVIVLERRPQTAAQQTPAAAPPERGGRGGRGKAAAPAAAGGGDGGAAPAPKPKPERKQGGGPGGGVAPAAEGSGRSQQQRGGGRGGGGRKPAPVK